MKKLLIPVLIAVFAGIGGGANLGAPAIQRARQNVAAHGGARAACGGAR